jgi:hypothetical protein
LLSRSAIMGEALSRPPISLGKPGCSGYKAASAEAAGHTIKHRRVINILLIILKLIASTSLL